MKKSLLFTLFCLTLLLVACSDSNEPKMETTDKYKNVQLNINEGGETAYFGANTNAKNLIDFLIQFNKENELTADQAIKFKEGKITSYKGYKADSQNEWFVMATCKEDLFADDELCLVEDITKYELKEGDFAVVLFGQPEERIKFQQSEIDEDAEEIKIDPSN